MRNNLIPGKKIPSLEVNTLNDTLWSVDDYLDKAKYMIVGIGINLISNPKIANYPTTNLRDVSDKKVNKNEIILKLKKIYENFIPKLNSSFTGKTL